MKHQNMTEQQIGSMNGCQQQDAKQLDDVIYLIRPDKRTPRDCRIASKDVG